MRVTWLWARHYTLLALNEPNDCIKGNPGRAPWISLIDGNIPELSWTLPMDFISQCSPVLCLPNLPHLCWLCLVLCLPQLCLVSRYPSCCLYQSCLPMSVLLERCYLLHVSALKSSHLVFLIHSLNSLCWGFEYHLPGCLHLGPPHQHHIVTLAPLSHWQTKAQWKFRYVAVVTDNIIKNPNMVFFVACCDSREINSSLSNRPCCDSCDTFEKLSSSVSTGYHCAA